MEIICYFDYTCGYSYKALLWLDRVPDARVEWRTACLKEINRREGEPSAFDEPEVPSRSVLALALAHATRDAGGFEAFHRDLFHAMHGDGRTLEHDEMIDVAARAGLDATGFRSDVARWVSAVAAEHRDAVERWQIFGTPTLILGGDCAVFLKFSKPPGSDEDARKVFESLHTLAVSHPELVEIKRPG